MMTGLESAKNPWEDEPLKIDAKVILNRLAWVIGLVSTIYLVGYASFLTFLAVVFGSPIARADPLGYLALIGQNSIPACCYAAIGILGLKCLSSRRLWLLGLSAILAETAMAIYAFTNPGSMPLFTDWLL